MGGREGERERESLARGKGKGGYCTYFSRNNFNCTNDALEAGLMAWPKAVSFPKLVFTHSRKPYS